MDVRDNVQDFVERKKAGLHALLLNWAGTLEGDARQNAPWKDRFGHARQGIHAGVDVLAEGFILFLAHGMRYGEYLEKGTGIYGPHKKPIKPVKKKALYGPGLPHPVKQIKGMKPQPIIKPTVDANIERIRKTVSEYWRD